MPITISVVFDDILTAGDFLEKIGAFLPKPVERPFEKIYYGAAPMEVSGSRFLDDAAKDAVIEPLSVAKPKKKKAKKEKPPADGSTWTTVSRSPEETAALQAVLDVGALSGPTILIDDVRAAMSKLLAAKGMPAVQKVLATFNVARIGELSALVYRDFIAECEK